MKLYCLGFHDNDEATFINLDHVERINICEHDDKKYFLKFTMSNGNSYTTPNECYSWCELKLKDIRKML